MTHRNGVLDGQVDNVPVTLLPLWLLGALGIRPRRKPTQLAPTAVASEPHEPQNSTGTMFIQDIYQGMTGIERGRVKYVRVMGVLPWPWGVVPCPLHSFTNSLHTNCRLFVTLHLMKWHFPILIALSAFLAGADAWGGPLSATTCNAFWEVTIQKGEKIHRSGENSLYSPAGVPHAVAIHPGKTYSRLIQPAAYVFREEHLSQPYSITVTYRVLKKKREQWSGLCPNADMTLSFSTPAIHRGNAAGEQPAWQEIPPATFGGTLNDVVKQLGQWVPVGDLAPEKDGTTGYPFATDGFEYVVYVGDNERVTRIKKKAAINKEIDELDVGTKVWVKGTIE